MASDVWAFSPPHYLLTRTRLGRVVESQFSLTQFKSEVDGRSVAYLSGGNGPLLLFIHGWAVTPVVYRDALELAAKAGNRVIAPFLPGFGPSEPLDRFWQSSLSVGRWISAFLDQVGEERPAIVIGHSLGGGFAASYAAHFPSGIEKLYLMSSVGGYAIREDFPLQSRSALQWSLSLPLDLLASQATYGGMISIVGTGLVQLVRDPIGLWRLSRIARDYRLFDELDKILASGTQVFVVGALSDRVITQDAVSRLAGYASVAPIWVSGTHSWISTHPMSFVEVLTSGP